VNEWYLANEPKVSQACGRMVELHVADPAAVAERVADYREYVMGEGARKAAELPGLLAERLGESAQVQEIVASIGRIDEICVKATTEATRNR
jgi:hypothetical protein